MFKSHLTIAAMALTGSVIAETDIQACMYCKRADTRSGYGVSFSYCGDSQYEKCYKNFWEYINPSLQCVSSVT